MANDEQLWTWHYGSPRFALEEQTDRIVEAIDNHRTVIIRDHFKTPDRAIISPQLIQEHVTGLENISAGIDRLTDGFRAGQLSSMDRLTDILRAGQLSGQESAREIERALQMQGRQTSHDLANISSALSDLTCIVADGQEEIAGLLTDLNSRFDWAIDEIIPRLDVAIYALQNPLSTQGVELKKWGIDAFRNRWYEEAKDNFSRSEKKFDRDPTVHYYLGKIALSQENLSEALIRFQKMAKYANHIDQRDKKPAAYAELQVARTHYLMQKFREATEAARRAIAFNASPEAYYQFAHYLTLSNPSEEEKNAIMNSLFWAIECDPGYLLRIDKTYHDFEKDFDFLMPRLEDLKRKLNELARGRALLALNGNRAILERLASGGADKLTGKTQQSFSIARGLLDKVKEYLDRQSYFDSLMAIKLCGGGANDNINR